MPAVPYRIRNLASGKILANPQGSRKSGTKMIQWDEAQPPGSGLYSGSIRTPSQSPFGRPVEVKSRCSSVAPTSRCCSW